MEVKTKILCLGVITVLAIIGLWSLITHPFYTSHDGFTHTARIASYYQALRDGQFPPRWASNLNGGMGSPIFTYIYPLPYFLGSSFHFLGFPYEDSFRLVMEIGYFLSGVTMFFWLRNKFGNLAGLVGAVSYLWVPYHFLNVYVRAAFAENLAYVFPPLIFLCIEKIYDGKNRYLYPLAFSVLGLLLAHNEVSALILPLMAGWIAVQTYLISNKRALFSTLIGLVCGIGMAAFIYLPDLLERNFIRFDQGISYYQEHFVAWWQLLRSPWGYGFDLPGTVNDAMSFQLGLGQILISILVLLLIIWKLFSRNLPPRKFLFGAGFFGLVLAVSIFLMVDEPLIRPVWQHTPVLKTIVDFPWRFLGVTTIAFAYLAAYLVFELKNNKIIVLILLAAMVLFNRNHLKINLPLNFSDKTFTTYDGTATAQSNEYTPFWHETYDFQTRKNPVVALNPKMMVNVNSNSAKGISFQIKGQDNSSILINRFFFPATTIIKDGRLLKYGTNWEILNKTSLLGKDDSGLILLKNASAGSYQVKFADTVLRRLGNLISLVIFLTVILSWLWQGRVLNFLKTKFER